MKPSIHAILFDLDGTLLDTAPDLIHALNQLREMHGLPKLPFHSSRSLASLGSKAMIKTAFGITENHPKFDSLRNQFLTFYENNIALSTRFFPSMEQVLDLLDHQQLPWGIVTNKLTRHTLSLLKALQFDHRPGCIICGDSLPTFKPDPAPILQGCKLLKQDPKHCIYIGDTATDVIASKAAGTLSLVALYGYIDQANPKDWQADGYVNEPKEIIDWIAKYP